MKMNKKVAIPLLSTVMGLAVIGGASGAVAWYQYNTRVTSSFIGSSVADGGSLQISSNGTDWKRDVYDTGSTNNNKLIPVTFGNSNVAKNAALPNVAHAYPEAGVPSVEDWSVATKGKEYVQYKIYLRALENDSTVTGGKTQVSKKVYLSDITLAAADGSSDIAEALRIHLDVKNGGKFLISNAGGDTNLFGSLDLDPEAGADKVGGYEFSGTAQERAATIVYGAADCIQSAYSVAEMEVASADIPTASDDALICETPEGSGSTEITITCWLEGWEKLNNNSSAIWDPTETGGQSVHVGLTFDVGPETFKD